MSRNKTAFRAPGSTRPRRGVPAFLRSAGLALLALASCRTERETADVRPRSPEGERAAALAAAVEPVRAPQVASRPSPAEPYRLGPRDVVEIAVLDHPEWRQEVPVRPDGKVAFLLVGEVPAAGRTPEELRGDLQRGLEAYVKRPQVSVAVREFRSRFPHVYVAGEVRQPGAFELTPPHDSFLDAVFAAGGVTPDADLPQSYVVRRGNVIAADFDRLLHEGDRGANFVLEDGDFAYFPQKDFRFVYVLGQVRNPQAVSAPRPIKLLEAVARAGGLTPTTFKLDLHVVRGGLRSGKSFTVDFERLAQGDLEANVWLEPGDIVFAPRHPLTTWNALVNEVLPTLSGVVLGNVLREQSNP
ncbi:MAG TPA: polysaccharide biosynthesis/export family protein [Planctomycetota bacterium]|jgi:polysaccharide export outer membrane protein|nr:polysaccharide biosynthesis/export family protein [Planctomycetota bacterium]